MIRLLILSTVLTLAGYVTAALLRHRQLKIANKNGYYKPDWSVAGSSALVAALVLSVVMVTLGITTLSLTLSTAGEVQRLEAFYHDTLSTYEYVVDRSEQIVVRVSASEVITDFANIDQAAQVAERLRELRDRVEWYNESLRYLRQANEWPLLGEMYYDVPADLRPIILEP